MEALNALWQVINSAPKICYWFNRFDLIILDIGLPDGNGMDLLDAIKEHQNSAGVLILSAKDSLEDKLKGLDLGADDYMTKPFHMAELNSRVNAIIRRKNFDGQNEIRFNEIRIDIQGQQVYIDKLALSLTRREYELLLYLVTNRHRVVTREAIAEHLWGAYNDTVDHLEVVYSHIKNLRRKIKDAGANDYLKSVYGIGYKLTDE